jgi:transposase
MNTENENAIRKEKGMAIVQTCRIMKREKGGYVVPSQTGTGAYLVTYQDYKAVCECPDFENKGLLGVKCKHIWAVEFTINKKTHADGTVEYTVKKTYPQNWSAYNKAQTHQTELFMKLLYNLTDGIYKPYEFGRPSLPLCDVIFCSALKVYSTLSSRRTAMNYQIAKEKGYIAHKPHFNAVSKILNKEETTSVLLELIEVSALPLKSVETDFAVDSSGFGTSRFDRWFSFKYGKEVDSRVWVKCHLMNGVKTHIVTGVQITEAYSHDSKEFGKLVEHTAQNFTINEVSADKAYSSRENIETVANCGGTAFIPFKSNATGKQRGSNLWGKMYHYFMFNREDFLQQYHKRSNVETVFHMIKSKFGDSVRSKNHTAQVNEVLLKVLCHNICVVIQEMHELGIKPDFDLKTNKGSE